jgi:hypothetical protein
MKHTTHHPLFIAFVCSLFGLLVYLGSSQLPIGNATSIDLSDDFNDNSLDATKWSIIAPSSPATITEEGQRLQITVPANTATYNGIASVSTYDFRDKTMEVEVAQPISQAGWTENFIQVVLDSQNYYLVSAGAGSMVFRSMVAGVNDQTILNFDPTAARFWGIRHDQAANTVSLQTSPDGITWTTRKRVTASFSLTAVKFYLYAGAYGTGNSNPGAAKYDNFQVVDSNSRSINAALAVNGAVATASSSYSLSTQPSSTINGDHRGLNWGNNGGWADASPGSFPDWVQIDFEGNKTINEIDVFSLQDNNASPVEPTESMTFSLYGLSGYEVQYWNGASWLNVPGGAVTGNNLVWRKFTFTPLTTSKIRVLTNAAADGYSRIVEIEAFTTIIHPLAAQWQFDEGSGTTVNDSTGFGSTATAQSATWTTGRVGTGAMDFNGATSYATVNSAAPLVSISNNFTLSFWAYPRSTHEIDPEVTGGAAGVYGQRYVYGPNWYSNGDAGAGVSVGTNGISVYEHAATYMPATLVYQATLSGWTHIVVVYKNKQPKLYVNGVLVRTGLTSPKNSVHIQPWNIGGTSYGYFDGKVDELCVYKDSFTAADVQALYNTYQASNNGGTMSLESVTTGPFSNIQFFRQENGTDIANFGVAGLRNNGFGTLWVANMPLQIKKAYLYWHGSNNSVEGNLGGTLYVNGTQVQGTFLGKSSDNTWGYPNTVAWRSEITSMVNGNPNKSYFLSNFDNYPFFNPNGASLIILYSDGNSGNDFDVTIYNGNDGNSHSSFDSDGWYAPMSGIEYNTGQAFLDMHVADGQSVWNDNDVSLNNLSFLQGNWFQGATVPWGDGFFRLDGLWDIHSFNITSYLHAGPNSVTITSPALGVTPPLKDGLNLIVAVVKVPAVREVKLVTWEVINSPLTNNPNAGGGLRMYPDQRASDPNMRTVRVRATTTLGAGQNVFFKAFDLDDPSTNLAPVDTNGATGLDNRGSPQTGSLAAASVPTDSNGVATVVFTTSMHPGDNFMVAASKDSSYLNGVVVNGITLRDSANNPLPTVKAKATVMLTVWRKIHLEIDSMGTVDFNIPFGDVASIQPDYVFCGQPTQCPDFTRHHVGLMTDFPGYLEDHIDENRFDYNQGRLVFDHNESYAVQDVYDFGGTVEISTPNQLTPIGSHFELIDDDDYNDNDSPNDGDMGEDVNELTETFSLVQESDNPATNIFAPAYITPVRDGGGSNANNSSNVPFALNVPEGNNWIDAQINYGQNAVGSDSFWVCYIQLAYQGDVTEDNDVDEEGATGGITLAFGLSDNTTSELDVPRGADASLIFLEVMSDHARENFSDWRQRTVPHEMGHQFGIFGHTESNPLFGIMNANGLQSFAPQHLNILRWRVHSPGLTN